MRDPAVANIEGATLLLPEGWRLEGGFSWMPFLSMQANFLARVTDPASGAQAEWLPSQQFNWPLQDMGLPLQPGSNWNGSVLLPPPRDAVELVTQVLGPTALPHLRNARVVRVDDMPAWAAEQARSTPPQMVVRSTRIRFAHADREEDVTVTATFAPPNGWTAMWWCSGFALRARAGELDRHEPLLSIPIRSLRFTLEWSAALEHVRRVNAQGRMQDMIATQQLGDLMRRHRAEMAEQHRQVWEDRLASQDRQNHAMREILGGVDTYRDPFEGRPVELPTGYAACWATRDGYVLSHDPSFDPRPGSTTEFRRVDRAG